MKRMFRNGRFANVTAMIALVLAMGGTSYAAYTLPHNSVGSWQIKYKSVKNADIGSNAITSSKVQNGSLHAQDFDSYSLPAGPQGAPGEAVAYATVFSNGQLVAGRNKNVVYNDVYHQNTGVYCFSGMTADGQQLNPTSAMVTVEGTGTITKHIAAVSIGTGLNGCSTTTPGVLQVRVDITDISVPMLANNGFSIWFEK